MESIHQLNIIAHVTFGSLALITGLFLILGKKGSTQHIRWGWIFNILIVAVILTAFVGSTLFNFRPFLFLLTLTAFYTTIMGVRVLRLKGKRPEVFDMVIIGVTLILLLIYPFFEPGENVNTKNTPVLFSTILNLSLNMAYDMGKWFYSLNWLKRTMIQDHIIRMLSSFSALFSAFSGNVLPEIFKPYSQLVPSVICMGLMIYFIYGWNKKTKTA